MNRLVSIIVPVYNVENYLEECLQSIEKQTYKNLEVILVNDGSTDLSYSICEKYAKKNGWILINRINGGLSAARNSGLEKATGDYIYFIDSDDWIKEEMIETLVKGMEKYNAGIVECGVQWVFQDKIVDDSEEKTIVLNRQEALESYLLQTRKIHSAVCCKLYRKEVIDTLKFEEGKLHEDGFFMYKVMYNNIFKYVVLAYAGYYYRQNRPGSIMTSKIKPQNIIDVTEMMEERNDYFCEKKEYALAEMSASYYYRTTLTTYITAINDIGDDRITEWLENKLRLMKKEILKNKYLKIKKVKFVLFYYTPWLFERMYIKKD